MGGLECAGCAMIAFGPAFSLFAFIIAPDPLRVIIFVAGAFFWLLSLFTSSLIWYTYTKIFGSRGSLEFGLVEAIMFQEVFRYLYYLLLKKAEQGLDKVSAKGMHIEGVHSLKNAKHTTSFVVGLGFGTMSGAFSLVNVLADGSGPGTLGLPKVLEISNHYGTYTFFLTSSLLGATIILLHVAWNVLFWHGLEKANYGMVAAVIVSHFFVSLMTLLNQKVLYYVTLPVAFITLIALAIWSYVVAGGSFSNFKNTVFQCCTCKFIISNLQQQERQQQQQPRSSTDQIRVGQ